MKKNRNILCILFLINTICGMRLEQFNTNVSKFVRFSATDIGKYDNKCKIMYFIYLQKLVLN